MKQKIFILLLTMAICANASDTLKINFQAPTSSTPANWHSDIGDAFASRGGGLEYGWNFNNSVTARERFSSGSPDKTYDTFQHMQKPENPAAEWEIALNPGTYRVRLCAGDPLYFDSNFKIDIEGVRIVDGEPSTETKWVEGTELIDVLDGRLTISNGVGAINNKICFVEITPIFRARVNFQPASTSSNTHWLIDNGSTYAARGNGFDYGWLQMNNETRTRLSLDSATPQYDSLIHMQKPSCPNAVWEIAVPNGFYTVHVVAGDALHFDSVYKIDVENVPVVSAAPSANSRWHEGTAIVLVNDGKLTLSNGVGAVNNKLCFVEILATNQSEIPWRGSGDGLQAYYFDDNLLPSQSIAHVDEHVNFQWNDRSPSPGISANTFKATWSGLILAQYTESYTIYVRGDDGVRLYLNGKKVIDKWINQPATEYSAKVQFSAGTFYDIRLEYYQAEGRAVSELRWSSASTPKSIIPKNQLYSRAQVTGTNLTGLSVALQTPTESYTNPAWVEGYNGSLVSQMSVESNGEKYSMSRESKSRWYANDSFFRAPNNDRTALGVWLSANAPTPIKLIASDGISSTNEINIELNWKPLAISGHAGSELLMIRRGDTLRLTAGDTALQNVEIKVNGPNGTQTHSFVGSGLSNFEFHPDVVGSHSIFAYSGNALVGFGSVAVIDVMFPQSAACQIGYQRAIAVDVLGTGPQNIDLSSGDIEELLVIPLQPNQAQARVNMTPLSSGSPKIMARIGSSVGPVIRLFEVDEFIFDSTARKNMRLVQSFDDQSILADATITLYPYIKDLNFKVKITTSGVRFEDLSMEANILSNTFLPQFTESEDQQVGADGVYRMTGSSITQKFCHTITVFQNGIQVSR